MTGSSSMAKRILLISAVSTVVMAYVLIAGLTGKQTQKKSGHPNRNQLNRDLQQLGEKVARAVLDKDIPTLLTYDRADLRSEDELVLKNTKSDFTVTFLILPALPGATAAGAPSTTSCRPVSSKSKLAWRDRRMITSYTEACFSTSVPRFLKKTSALRTFYARNLPEGSLPGSLDLKVENGER